MSWSDITFAGHRPPAMRFPHCANCQKAPGRLCGPHGAALVHDETPTAESEAQA